MGRGQGDWLDRGNRPKKTGETVDRRQNNGRNTQFLNYVLLYAASRRYALLHATVRRFVNRQKGTKLLRRKISTRFDYKYALSERTMYGVTSEHTQALCYPRLTQMNQATSDSQLTMKRLFIF